jgi:hypothetical protein
MSNAELLPIAADYFLAAEFEDQVSNIRIYFRSTALGKRRCDDAIPCDDTLLAGNAKSKLPSTPLVQIVCPPLVQITSDKEVMTSFQACRGWTGDQYWYEPLFRQSWTEFSYSAAMAAQPTHVFGLASVYTIKGAQRMRGVCGSRCGRRKTKSCRMNLGVEVDSRN